MSLTANWSYPTSIRFGAGRIQELGDACLAAGIKKPLLVTDRGLADLPITERAMDILRQGGLNPAKFADVDTNPNEKNLDAGLAVFREGGHDGVVAFG
ncbi:MAG: iron-containing alcohol dehydrogenase, partial [Rhodobacteraceae bacterium]|nr:iron-containing alcohol dehydrogenase [Paracoccaceae bacterium]